MRTQIVYRKTQNRGCLTGNTFYFCQKVNTEPRQTMLNKILSRSIVGVIACVALLGSCQKQEYKPDIPDRKQAVDPQGGSDSGSEGTL